MSGYIYITSEFFTDGAHKQHPHQEHNITSPPKASSYSFPVVLPPVRAVAGRSLNTMD